MTQKRNIAGKIIRRYVAWAAGGSEQARVENEGVECVRWWGRGIKG